MRIAVLGGGSWGTALAVHLARARHGVRIWLRDADVAEQIARERENKAYLPGVAVPAEVEPTTAVADALGSAELVVMVIPSQFCREVYRSLRAHLPPGVGLVSATKGIETATLRRMTEVASEEAPGHPLAVLSGPSFALEVAHGQPTAVVVASRDAAFAEALQRAVSTPSFRAYASDDVVGAELAGALKNVIAIAAGIVDGLGMGHNTVAALITRGLAEIARLGVARGGRADTFSGLAGLGDLVLTCTGGLSRNRRLGQALGRGRSLAEATAALRDATGHAMVAEGVPTTLAAAALAAEAGVEMPIVAAMKEVLHEGRAPRDAVLQLMSRSLKRE
ncbi:MAG TPA: NAD(P)H-dependent glycerol-3-phosphate dehydrogenase [Vicinamibacteria bacterium]|nr:NAD(P)H-dependent glycerol-3-phosphate dehydrogenase [Vicinamibacteria bacterium]